MTFFPPPLLLSPIQTTVKGSPLCMNTMGSQFPRSRMLRGTMQQKHLGHMAQRQMERRHLGDGWKMAHTEQSTIVHCLLMPSLVQQCSMAGDRKATSCLEMCLVRMTCLRAIFIYYVRLTHLLCPPFLRAPRRTPWHGIPMDRRRPRRPPSPSEGGPPCTQFRPRQFSLPPYVASMGSASRRCRPLLRSSKLPHLPFRTLHLPLVQGLCQ